jgi:heme/copper-type cytochrome/quinol oxidase subunit 3
METNAALRREEFKAGTELGLDHRKLGMWLFLSSEIMFFGGLIAAFLHFKINTPSPAEAALLDVTLIGVNTFILLSSSFAVVLGLAAIQKGKSKTLAAYIALTILLGMIFLGGQSYEFTTLFSEGMTLQSSVYGSGFFTLTGFHGLHVFIGIIWAVFLFFKAIRGKFSENDYEGYEIFGLYWHFVDIVWIVLFTIIYLV